MSTSTLPRTPAGWFDLARSGPQPEQQPAVVTAVYRLWLLAFTLKMLGSSWDMSWHFKWLRDTAAPPHLINTVGTVLVVALVIFQARYGVGVDRVAKRLMVFGTGLFLIAIPIDVLNHEINGLDITAWSFSHALLYLGTAFMLLGCARGYWLSTPPGRTRTIVSGVIWAFFLENVLFASQHQEYGTLAYDAWRAGRPTAEPSLLKFAADQIGHPIDDASVHHFSLPVEAWVYPAWMAGAALLTLVVARHFVGARWTATSIAGGYLAYRGVAWLLLVGTGFPPSLPPFLLLAGAVVIDLVFLASATATVYATRGHLSAPVSAPPAAALGASPSRATAVMAAIFGATLATGAIAAATWTQHLVIGTPPISYVGFVYGGLALAAGWIALNASVMTRATPST